MTEAIPWRSSHSNVVVDYTFLISADFNAPFGRIYEMFQASNPSLQPLRIPTGWAIEWNVFLDVDPIFEAGDEKSIGFGEDLLQISHKINTVLIDLGWYPAGDPEGDYRLLAIRRHSNDDEMRSSWAKPLRTLASHSRTEIVRALEEWLWHNAHHAT